MCRTGNSTWDTSTDANIINCFHSLTHSIFFFIREMAITDTILISLWERLVLRMNVNFTNNSLK